MSLSVRELLFKAYHVYVRPLYENSVHPHFNFLMFKMDRECATVLQKRLRGMWKRGYIQRPFVSSFEYHFQVLFISISFNIPVLTLAAVPAPPTTDTVKEPSTVDETESTTLIPPSPTAIRPTTGV